MTEFGGGGSQYSSKLAWTKYGAAKQAVLSCLLGVGIGAGIFLYLLSDTIQTFGLYLASLCVFHMWEYIWVSMYHPNKLSSDSFLLNHSPAFNIALAAGFTEYWVEWYFFPGMKQFTFLPKIGILLTIFGQVTRTLAMITAGSNFTHIVQEHKRKEHELVTTGIYSYLRHPSYFGWFIWSVSTQLTLFNPICIIGYTFASWAFFNERIEEEEEFLIKFFGQQYVEYKKRVWSGIPLIK
ncbi:prenylcysteine methyltransferase [Tieghemostelium lacteum]|uniref:Protein-S-isoprenylcysteine O-methyltransferase n=1 Tax=Tieghemostelium lacteum TaxID=361077 RepID=A0A151ZB43_TIELA|nr:prenylcysteine methyltransferase [Tieghemostelium lacteum]|eukprot:KYQ91104.1 prenylcysteine methyltransferase [Tieghemostelium lacteum]